VVVFLFLFPGRYAQASSPMIGLAWTELFCFLVPAVAASAGSNLRPGRFLRLVPWPGAGPIALAVLAGLAGNVVADALMAFSQFLLPRSWLEMFDLSRLFAGPPWERALTVVVTALVAPVCEEVAFRGYIQTALSLRQRPAAAMAGTAVLFALMHLDPFRFVALVFLGALFGWLVWRAGSVWPAVVAHAASNGLAVGIALGTGMPSAAAERPSVAASALALGAGTAVLLPVLVGYRAATPAPPAPSAALAVLDPSRPAGRFAADRLPPGVAALPVAGVLALAALLFHGLLRGAK
jgi:membrane protease YdiL (CAAX protease family)